MGQLVSLKLFFIIFFKVLGRKWKRILAVLFITGFSIFALILVNPLKSTSVSEGIIGTYQTHDIPQVVTKLLSESLVEFDENGRVTGKLITGWEVNSEGTIYKFKLKDNLYWSDGTKVNSSDIEVVIPDVEVSYPDNSSIQFKLKNPFSPFPSLLTDPVFKKGTLVGTGPYRIKSIEKSRIFITKLFLQKFDSSFEGIPEIIIRFYPNETTAELAFELGEVQSIFGVSDPGSSQSNLSKQIQKTNYNVVVSILYNTKDPALSNRSFRQALSYAAPEIKNEALARTSVRPNSWGFTDDVNDYLDNYNSSKAALTRAKNSSSPEILKKEIVLTSTPQLESVGKQIVSAWKAQDINAVLRVESGIPQNFQALLITQSIPVDPDQYSLWHSTQEKTNLTKYSSARVDKDLEDGRKLLKEEERKQKYIDFQKHLLEDSPATFLYFPKYNVVYLKKIDEQLSKLTPLQLP